MDDLSWENSLSRGIREKKKKKKEKEKKKKKRKQNAEHRGKVVWVGERFFTLS